MNPLLDQFAVAALVAGALAYFIVRHLRRRAAGRACGSDCGCSAKRRPEK